MIITYEHHGKLMHVEDKNKGKHSEVCLCHQGCNNYQPNSEFNCPIAQKLFEFDVEHGVTTPVWECMTYVAGDKETYRLLELEREIVRLKKLNMKDAKIEKLRDEIKELEKLKFENELALRVTEMPERFR